MTAEEIKPEKWALELWHAADDAAAECARDEAGYPNYAAAIVIQRAFEERERERLDRIAESVGETIAAEFGGFWAKEDLLEEIPSLIRQALATAALKAQDHQP